MPVSERVLITLSAMASSFAQTNQVGLIGVVDMITGKGVLATLFLMALDEVRRSPERAGDATQQSEH